MVNVVRVVPGGVVTFLPSYQYEKQVVAYLKQSGRWDTIAEKKEVSWPGRGERGRRDRRKRRMYVNVCICNYKS